MFRDYLLQSYEAGDETRGVLREARIRIGAEPHAARDGLGSSRGAGTARRDRAAAALYRWGWFGLRDFGFAVRHWARRKVGGREQGRVRASVRERPALGLDFGRTE